ncbi:MAG: ATP-dependent 6-phosphofructokinase [Malacoplasma sp.]|nr:ATP-dependent 6-phosphofructokinase [Malacoplasma sp.]
MKRVAVLTSGGDASTMNKCLSTLVTYAAKFDCEIYFVKEGYKGLYENQIYKADLNETRSWWKLPGTKIYSSRFPQILDSGIKEQMAQNLEANQIDCLIVIGGDGSYKGASLLSSIGTNVICLPGTIDNDVTSTTYSIGFDTALNTIVNAITEIKSCMDSHQTIGFVEIMGRHCIDLTVFAAIATESDIIITPESFYTPQELLARINQLRQTITRSLMVLYVENFLGTDNIPSAQEYVSYIHQNSKELVKKNVLGYMQRGGVPTAMDLYRSSLMCVAALKLINQNTYNKIIGIKNDFPTVYGLKEGLEMKNPSRKGLIEVFFK